MICAHGLTRSYSRSNDAITALDRADFDAKSGELVLVTGPSGSGKSTLLSIIGLLELDGNSFLGANRDWSPEEEWDTIGKILTAAQP